MSSPLLALSTFNPALGFIPCLAERVEVSVVKEVDKSYGPGAAIVVFIVIVIIVIIAKDKNW